MKYFRFFFFFSSRRRHTRSLRDWSSDVCSSDLAEVVMPQTPSLHARQTGGTAGWPGGVHRPWDRLHRGYLPCPARLRGPCFWWTACLLTLNRLAISCQDQPLERAFSTCRASSTSTRPRRAATARRPTSGSRLLAAAKVASSGSAIFSIASR